MDLFEFETKFLHFFLLKKSNRFQTFSVVERYYFEVRFGANKAERGHCGGFASVCGS